MTFRVGQKVVCVADCWAISGTVNHYPQKNQVYTIRGIDPSDCGTNDAYLRLVEIRNPRIWKRFRLREAAFNKDGFRPVVDISDLESIVSEVKLGRPRKIQDDQFDRKRVHSSAALPRQRAGWVAPDEASPSCTQPALNARSTEHRRKKERERKQRLTAETPGWDTARMKTWRQKNRQKYLAHKAVEYAIVSGRLTRQPCERCGAESGVHAHHDDYSRPIDVKWLCPIHHQERHRELASRDASHVSPTTARDAHSAAGGL